MVKRFALSAIAIVLLLTLAGCTGRTLVISWDPNPVIVKKGATSITGTVTFQATGTFGSLRVDKVSVAAYDGGETLVDSWEYNANVTIPMFVSGKHAEKVTLNVGYDDVKNNGVEEVVISVTGSDPGTLKIKVIAEE